MSRLKIGEVPRNILYLFGCFAIFLAAIAFLAPLNPQMESAINPDNPRLKRGMDTIFVGDSAYVIHFHIDSAYAVPVERVSDERAQYP